MESRDLGGLGELFGGATALPQGRGVWRDDARGGRLVFDTPVVINCETSETRLEAQAPRLRPFRVDILAGTIGLVIDQNDLDILFRLREAGDG